jgi:hypothetical protein
VSVAPHTQYEWCLPFNTVIAHSSYFWCEMLYPRFSPFFILFPINSYFLALSNSCQELSLSHVEYRNSICFVCPSLSEDRKRDEHTNSNRLETLCCIPIIHVSLSLSDSDHWRQIKSPHQVTLSCLTLSLSLSLSVSLSLSLSLSPLSE